MFYKMHKFFSKKISLIFIIFALSLNPVAAMGLPVMDITSILQTIIQTMQDVKDFTAQLHQWKSDYERIAKAAKALGSGDFNTVMSSLKTIVDVSGLDTLDYVNAGVFDSIFDTASNIGNSVISWEKFDWSGWASAWDSGDNSYDSLLNAMEHSSLFADKVIESANAASNIAISWDNTVGNAIKISEKIENLNTKEEEILKQIETSYGNLNTALENQNTTMAEQYKSEYDSLLYSLGEVRKKKEEFWNSRDNIYTDLRNEALDYYTIRVHTNLIKSTQDMASNKGWDGFKERLEVASSRSSTDKQWVDSTVENKQNQTIKDLQEKK